MPILCANPDCCRDLSDTSDKYSTLEFGKEMYFCSKPHMFNGNTDCLRYYRKKHQKESIAYNGGGLGGVAKDLLGVTGLKQELSQTATGKLAVSLGGAAFGLVGKAIASHNSEDAKLARLQKEAEKLQKEIEDKKHFVDNFNPRQTIESAKGLFKKSEISGAVGDCERMFDMFEKSILGYYDKEKYLNFYKSYEDSIAEKTSEAIAIINEYKPKAGEKYQKKYNILQCYKNIKEEADAIGGENTRKLNENLEQQKNLIDTVNNLSKELYSPANQYLRTMKIYAAYFKAIIPFNKFSKQDAIDFREECKQKVADLKQALVQAKQNKKENLGKLKKEVDEIKKEGNAKLAEINKKLKRFERYKPNADELEAELKKIGNL